MSDARNALHELVQFPSRYENNKCKYKYKYKIYFGLPIRGAFVEFCAFALLYQPCPGDHIDYPKQAAGAVHVGAANKSHSGALEARHYASNCLK
jgi:hypothetical protein